MDAGHMERVVRVLDETCKVIATRHTKRGNEKAWRAHGDCKGRPVEGKGSTPDAAFRDWEKRARAAAGG